MYIGLDIGGTKFMVAASTDGIHLTNRVRSETPAELNEGIELLHQMVAQVSDSAPIQGIGAAVGGPLDWRSGVVSPLHQHNWQQVPLREIMQKRWNCPFHVDVDTNVAAFGEYVLGEYTASRFLYITVSTGIGGGFIVDGKIYRGFGGEHPEIGHHAANFNCANPEAVHCECGAPDCLEAVASGNGIRRIYGKPAEQLSETEWQEVTYNFGLGVRNLVAIYLPEVIVLGGGVAYGRGQKFIDGIHAVLKTHLKILPIPKICISELGYDTALMGAITIAKRGLV